MEMFKRKEQKPIVTRGPFSEHAEGVSVCGTKGFVIYRRVLTYQVNKLAFNFRFRTFEDSRVLIGKLKQIEPRRVIIFIHSLKLFLLYLNISLFSSVLN